MPKYSLCQLDVCTSDYFGGYHGSTLQVAIDGNSTYQSIKDDCLDIYWATDHIEDMDVEAYKEAVEECFKNVPDMSAIFNASIEICPENEEYSCNWKTCWLFLGLDVEDDD